MSHFFKQVLVASSTLLPEYFRILFRIFTFAAHQHNCKSLKDSMN